MLRVSKRLCQDFEILAAKPKHYYDAYIQAVPPQPISLEETENVRRAVDSAISADHLKSKFAIFGRVEGLYFGLDSPFWWILKTPNFRPKLPLSSAKSAKISTNFPKVTWSKSWICPCIARSEKTPFIILANGYPPKSALSSNSKKSS